MKKFLSWAFVALFIPTLIVGCSDDDDDVVVDPANLTELNATIEAAQVLHDNAVEGTEPLQYEVGSKEVFQAAIDQAIAVRDMTGVSQTAVDNANISLEQAVGVFESKLITNIAPEALVGHWTFNGNADDITGNGNNGTAMTGHEYWGAGIPALTADRFGNTDYCYYLNQGANIQVPYSTALNPTSMTISLWIKMEEQDNNDYMVSMNRWNGYKLNLQTENFLFFTVKADEGGEEPVYYDRDSNPAYISADEWTHVTVSFTPGEMKFYVNGELVKTWDNTPGTPVSADNIDLTFGSDLPTGVYSTDEASPYYVNWGGFFKGAMDDVRFYNIQLTDAQVMSIYSFEKENVQE